MLHYKDSCQDFVCVNHFKSKSVKRLKLDSLIGQPRSGGLQTGLVEG